MENTTLFQVQYCMNTTQTLFELTVAVVTDNVLHSCVLFSEALFQESWMQNRNNALQCTETGQILQDFFMDHTESWKMKYSNNIGP